MDNFLEETDWSYLFEGSNISNVDFFEARRKGARLIASEAKSKGGPSFYTYLHFKNKYEAYTDILNSIKTNKPANYYKNKATSLMNKLHNNKITLDNFEQISGEYECYMEAWLKLR